MTGQEVARRGASTTLGMSRIRSAWISASCAVEKRSAIQHPLGSSFPLVLRVRSRRCARAPGNLGPWRATAVEGVDAARVRNASQAGRRRSPSSRPVEVRRRISSCSSGPWVPAGVRSGAGTRGQALDRDAVHRSSGRVAAGRQGLEAALNAESWTRGRTSAKSESSGMKVEVVREVRSARRAESSEAKLRAPSARSRGAASCRGDRAPAARRCQRVSRGEREHPLELFHAFRAQLLVEVNDHLGVAVRPERVAAALEAAPQLPVVVDLAVQDNRHRAVLVVDRLIARLEVDHPEALNPQPHLGIEVNAARVRSAMLLGRAHRVDRLAVDPATVRPDLACDPAHASRLFVH